MNYRLLLLTPLLAACASKTVTSPPAAPPIRVGEYQFVPTVGDCHDPRWSPAGDRLLYRCMSRSGHELDQLYVYDRIRGIEQRVTWQVGAITGHDWVSNDRVVYSSTTDEMKERLFRSGSVEAGLGSDVYVSDLAGETIQRLTDEPGADRVIRWDAGGSRVLIESARPGRPSEIRWLTLSGKSSPAEPPREVCQPPLKIGEAPLLEVDIRGPWVAGVQKQATSRKIFWKEAALEQLSCAPESPPVK